MRKAWRGHPAWSGKPSWRKRPQLRSQGRGGKGKSVPGPRAGVCPKSFLAGNRRSADWEEGVGQYGGEGGGKRVGPGRAGVGHEKLQHLHCPWHEPGTVHTPLT